MLRSILVLFIFGGYLAFAQVENLNARDPQLNEGSLFTVSLDPKAKRLLVSLAGQPQIELAAERVVVFGREISSTGKPKRLTIRPSGQGFQIIEELGSKVEIEVQDRNLEHKREIFRFDLP